MDLDWNVDVVNCHQAILDGAHVDCILEVRDGWKHNHFLETKCSLGALDLPLGKSLLVAFDGHDKIVWLALNEGSPVVLEVQSEKSFGGASEKHTAVGASDLAGSAMMRNVMALVFNVGL